MAWFSSMISSKLPTLSWERVLLHWRSSDFIDLIELFFFGLVLRFQFFLILDKLFFHYQVVRYPLEPQISQPALRIWCHWDHASLTSGKSDCYINALLLLFLTPHLERIALLSTSFYDLNQKYVLIDAVLLLALSPVRSGGLVLALLLSSFRFPS